MDLTAFGLIIRLSAPDIHTQVPRNKQVDTYI